VPSTSPLSTASSSQSNAMSHSAPETTHHASSSATEPKPFFGHDADDAREWLDYFERYIACNNITRRRPQPVRQPNGYVAGNQYAPNNQFVGQQQTFGRQQFRPQSGQPMTYNQNTSCNNCGRRHQQGSCRAYGQTCHFCGRVGHFANVCRQRDQTTQSVNQISWVQDPTSQQQFLP
jgi:hypothetical protein